MSSSHLSPIRRTASVIGSLLIAAGCTAPQEDQAPVTRSQPAPQADTPAATPPAATPAAPAASAPQILGTTVFEPPQASSMQPTAPVVGQKIESLRQDQPRQPQIGRADWRKRGRTDVEH